ncbi:MAG: hypothetical protein SGI98_04155 [Verrucomicrobiota bacterium]|nr:hypothetical protein [Verrucomicrobiota bacterium]
MTIIPLALFLCVAGILRAGDYYVFELKDGMIVRGAIVSENKDFFTVNLEESNGVEGQTQITKSHIAKKTKISDDEIAFKKLPKLVIHPRHSYSLKEYNNLIEAAEDFITAYPQSPMIPGITQALAPVKEEQLRVSRGEIKTGGEWLSPTEATFISYDIKANLLYDELLDHQQKNNFSEVKRVFVELEKKYPASIAYYQSGSQMIEWLDKQIKSKQIEIAAVDGKIVSLEKSKAENNTRINEAKAKASSASSPNYAATLKSQINVMQGMVNKINTDIKTIQNQVASTKLAMGDYQAELTRLQQTPFDQLSKQGNFIKQMELKFRSGKMSEVKNMLNLPELQKFERTRNINNLLGNHDKILQEMKSEINAKNFDAAIETGNNGLKEFPGSDQITALIEEARTARSSTAGIQN